MESQAQRVNANQATVRMAIINGVLPNIRTVLLNHDLPNLNEVRRWCVVAEQCHEAPPPSDLATAFKRMEESLNSKLERLTVRPLDSPKHWSETANYNNRPRVRFESPPPRTLEASYPYEPPQNAQNYFSPLVTTPRPPYQQQPVSPPLNQQQWTPYRSQSYPRQSRPRMMTQSPRWSGRTPSPARPPFPGMSPGRVANQPPMYSGDNPDICFNCGRSPRHDRAACPARNVSCWNCTRVGHFRSMCRSRPQMPPNDVNYA